MAFGGGGGSHPPKDSPPKKGKKAGGVVKYCSKTLKWRYVLILKKYYRTNVQGRIQIYYKLSFYFKITFDDKKYS